MLQHGRRRAWRQTDGLLHPVSVDVVRAGTRTGRRHQVKTLRLVGQRAAALQHQTYTLRRLLIRAAPTMLGPIIGAK